VGDDRRVYVDLLERQAQTFLSKAESMLGRRLHRLEIRSAGSGRACATGNGRAGFGGRTTQAADGNGRRASLRR